MYYSSHDDRYMNKRPLPSNVIDVHLHGHSHVYNGIIKRVVDFGEVGNKILIDVGIDGKLQLYSENDIIKLIEGS